MIKAAALAFNYHRVMLDIYNDATRLFCYDHDVNINITVSIDGNLPLKFRMTVTRNIMVRMAVRMGCALLSMYALLRILFTRLDKVQKDDKEVIILQKTLKYGKVTRLFNFNKSNSTFMNIRYESDGKSYTCDVARKYGSNDIELNLHD